jgi:hypothetical protein
VSGARLYPYDQYYASVADDNPFFAGKPQRFSTGEFSDCQPTRWCQAAEMFSEDYDEYQTLAVGWDRGSLAYLERLRKDLDTFESAVQTGAPSKSLEKTLQSLERKFERIRVITVQRGLGHVFYVEPYSVLTFDVSSRDLVQLDEPEKLGAFFGSLQESRGIKSTAELAPAPWFIPKQIEGEMVTGTLIVKRGSSQIFLCERIVLCRSGAFKDVQIKASSLAATADLLNTRPVYLDVKF